MWLTLGWKHFLLIFPPFYWFDQNSWLNKSKFSFSVIFNFWTKKRNSLWISPKMLQYNEKHSLAVCGSIWGQRTVFFKYLSPFTGLIKRNCLNKSKFSSRFTLFKHVKKNKLSEYFSAPFWDSYFFD